MNIKITSDSTCDLSEELLRKYDIDLIRLSVTLGEKTGKDGTEITPEDIYAYVDSTGSPSKTSAINIQEYQDFFSQFTEKGMEVIHFCLGSGFSSCYQNASVAAQSLPGVHVVDSQNLSTGQGLLVLLAADLRGKGMEASAIAEECNRIAPHVEASFVIDTMDYLYKGGRCSALKAFGANLLRLKPCIEVVDGLMKPGHLYRGPIDHVMQRYVQDRLQGREDIDKRRVFVTHTRCSKESVQQVIDKVKDLCPDFQEIHETVAGATITTHCGPNTLGVLYIRKGQDK